MSRIGNKPITVPENVEVKIDGHHIEVKGPKGTFDLGLESHKPIFEILCDTLKSAKEKYGVYVVWYIMTSNENNGATVDFFEKNKYFGFKYHLILKTCT